MIYKLFYLCLAFIAYVYAGYPLLLGLLTRIVPPKNSLPPLSKGEQDRTSRGRSMRSKQPIQPNTEQIDATPSVTLLIAAYNEETCIAEKLENSLCLDYPSDRLQILVAADGSNDRTADIVRSFTARGVELSYIPQRQGKMAAINRAMTQANGEIIVFSDANNLYDASTLRELVRPFADPKVGGVSGAKTIQRGDGVLGESEGLYWKYESWIKKQETRLGCCTGVSGEILALRQHLFEPAPEGIINDDFYMVMRLIARGYNLVYAPNARSRERVSPTAQDEVTRRSRIVAGRYQALSLAPRLLPWRRPRVVWQVISHKYLRPLIPLFMLGALITNLSLVAFGAQQRSRFLFFLLGQFLFYGAAWIGHQFKMRGLLGRLFYLPTFLVNSNWAALVGLYRYLTGGQSALWQRAARRENQPTL